MKNIKDNAVIQIEITNACHLSCANCSRFVGHHKKPFYMTLEEVETAINSLEGFPGRIGMMGGEPTLHPQFQDICKLYQKLIPNKRKRELWTAGYKWDEYRDIIKETFDEDLVHYNDHSRPEEGWHQPLLVAIDEVVDDKRKMWQLIDNCWVQQRWSASITPKGAYFCEVAAALDHVMEGPGGWLIEKGWWKKTAADYQEQKKRLCLRCSAALPMGEIPNNHLPVDLVSEGNAQYLKDIKSPKAKTHRIQIVSKHDATKYLNSVEHIEIGERGYLKSHPDWRPSEFRTKVWHGPGEGELSAKEVRSMQIKGKDLERISKNQVKGLNNKIVAEDALAYELNSKNIRNIEKLIGEKAAGLDGISNIKFKSRDNFLRSVSSWLGDNLDEGEKMLIVNEARIDN